MNAVAVLAAPEAAPEVDDRNRPPLRRLFSPVTLNRLTLPNRVMMSSMHLSLDDAPDQYERMARFYALRARTGIGLIVTAGASPSPEGRCAPEGFALDDDSLIPPHRNIVQGVHAAGGRIALQILHFGREAFHGRLVSASAERLESNTFTPRALDESGVRRVIADHAACARRAVAAGYDAVELIFSQGFLVHQFLAPMVNRRTDAWGGGFDNRCRLAVEIAAAVRAAVGPDYPLIFRVPCFDLVDGGLTAEESEELVRRLEPYGIDLLNVSIGWHESDTPTIAMVVPRAAYSPVAAGFRQRFPHLKVAVSNRINDPRTGERLLADGTADVIAMARPFLADPALVEKARTGAFHRINTCIACNQSCLDYVFIGRPVGCSVNPDCASAAEGEYPAFAGPRRIAVVGAGIAGLGAALFLARRGASVTVFERGREPGGQLLVASRVPDKQELTETVRFHVEELLHLGAELRCGRPVDAAALSGEQWDHVVIATGTKLNWPVDLPGIGMPHVIGYEKVLADGLPVTFPVAVIGGGGVACDVAKFLAADADRFAEGPRRWLAQRARWLVPDGSSERRITLLQRSTRKLAWKIGRTTRWILMQDLERRGVQALRGVDVEGIGADAVTVRERASGVRHVIPAATVVVATGQRPEMALIDTLRADLDRRGIPVSVIGAAAGGDHGGSITAALRSAHKTAMAIP